MQSRLTCIVVTVALLAVEAGRVYAQPDPGECVPYALNGTVLECVATGSPRGQLQTATFIAGSVAVGETLAQTLGLEVATAPTGSSSGGFTFTFDPTRRAWDRTSATFGPSFSERALTVGKGKLSAGLNVIARTYDTLDGLDLDGFTAFRFHGGSLAASTSRLQLQVRTETVAAFAHYGVLDNLDVGVLVPYVQVSVDGLSRIFGQADEELQRVRLDASSAGVGDIALFGKYRFWQTSAAPGAARDRSAALAAAVTVHVPTGDPDDLRGLDSTRALVALVGSATVGRLSPHVNIGYELWSDGVVVPRDFQGSATLSIKDQVHYSGGVEYELHPRLTLLGDVLGRFVRGGGRIGVGSFTFPPNRSNVLSADALVAVPKGLHTVVLAPGAKWNVYRAALLTGSVLVTLTDGGLRDRATVVLGIDWGF